MNIFNRLQRLNNENKIWIIYFFIAAFALLANHYEKDFLLKKDINDYQKEKTIHIVIFFVAFFIYLYFVLVFTEDLNTDDLNLITSTVETYPESIENTAEPVIENTIKTNN